MTYKTRNGREGDYVYTNSRIETLIEALDDLQARAPTAYTQRIALIHGQLKNAHKGLRQPAELIAFLYAPWSEQE